ncbi:MAG: hypothetical protein Q4D88_00810 [Anaerococcus sp.]|nr:hypothetical protein [Anaerococcus sp.]
MLNNVENPFGLSYNYTFFARDDTNKLSVDEVIDPDINDLLVLGLDDKEKILYIFDPSNFYLYQLENTNDRGRYFNKEDYREKKDVSLGIRNDIFVDLDQPHQFYQVSPQTDLYHKDIKAYKNLTSISNLPKFIYTDGNNLDQIDNISKTLTSHGYKSYKTSNSIFNLIKNNSNIFTSRYFFIAILGIATYFMAILSIYYYVKSKGKFIILSDYLGGSTRKICKKLLVEFVGSIVLGLFLALALSIFIITYHGGFLSLSLYVKSIFILTLMHLSIFIGSFMIFYIMIYRSLIGSKKEEIL